MLLRHLPPAQLSFSKVSSRPEAGFRGPLGPCTPVEGRKERQGYRLHHLGHWRTSRGDTQSDRKPPAQNRACCTRLQARPRGHSFGAPALGPATLFYPVLVPVPSLTRGFYQRGRGQNFRFAGIGEAHRIRTTRSH